MQLTSVHTNPFALLMTPDAVFAELEKSDCLRTLTSRVCKPLDDREATKSDDTSNPPDEVGHPRCT
jgi:hypothetical protein